MRRLAIARAESVVPADAESVVAADAESVVAAFAESVVRGPWSVVAEGVSALGVISRDWMGAVMGLLG